MIDNIRIALYAQIWRKPNLPCSPSLNLPRIYLLPLTSLRRIRIIWMIVYLSFSPIFICKLLKISGFGNYRLRLPSPFSVISSSDSHRLQSPCCSIDKEDVYCLFICCSGTIRQSTILLTSIASCTNLQESIIIR